MQNKQNNKMESTIKTTKLHKGVYLVIGKEVAMEINNDSGSYWEIDTYSENNKGMNKVSFYWEQFGTKSEAVQAVQGYDWEALDNL